MLKQAQIASAFADERTSEIIQLIADYQRAVKIAVTAMKKQFKSAQLLRDCRAGKFARRGALENPKGRYQFHGGGCRVEISKRVIDFDFGPDGRTDGFDAWRLNQYAQSAFEWGQFEMKQIEMGLAELTSAGLIHNPGLAPGTSLYYFAGDDE
jgi:hypothetical protein